MHAVLLTSEVGFSFLLDASGTLFTAKRKTPKLKDIESNTEAIEAVMRVSKGKGFYSSHILKASLLDFYTSSNLFPTGITPDMEVIDTWALRQSHALQRLVSLLKFPSRHKPSIKSCLWITDHI